MKTVWTGLESIKRSIEKIARSTGTVLITGESGTGKEHVARAIHEASPRKGCPWVAVNCSAISKDLLEAELFGIEKGTATGVEPRKGKFELANGGTIFLDEIGEMPPDAQAKLLRVLQGGEVARVGARNPRPTTVDVRVIAATNRPPEKALREDLFYRLNTFPLCIPPLRDRGSAIPDLALHFLAQFAERERKQPRGLHPQASGWLRQQRWPANARGVENLMHRVVVLGDESSLPVSAEELERFSGADVGIVGVAEQGADQSREQILATVREVSPHLDAPRAEESAVAGLWLRLRYEHLRRELGDESAGFALLRGVAVPESSPLVESLATGLTALIVREAILAGEEPSKETLRRRWGLFAKGSGQARGFRKLVQAQLVRLYWPPRDPVY